MKKQLFILNLLFGILSITCFADNYVIINQVMYDTPSNERPSVSPCSNGEYIELYNAGTTIVHLQGWRITGGSSSEIWTFGNNDSIPAGGFLILACKRGKTNTFVLSDLYNQLIGTDYAIIYQNKIILANDPGETVTLYNAQNDIVDQMSYGNSNHLYATNADELSGDSCISLHCTWVEFDAEGKVVQGTSKWTTDYVSFNSSLLPYETYYENYIMGEQTLPTGENFVLSITPLDPTTRIDINNSQPSLSSAIRTHTSLMYLDGLGRCEESIALGLSPNHKDLIELKEYYGLHKISRQWLPTVMQTEGQQVGSMEVQSQAQINYANNRPFSEILYENSASKRPTDQIQPGSAYESHANTQTYALNSESDQIRLYTVKPDSSLHTDGTYYGAATLYKHTTIDEDNKSVTTYKDKQERTIMEMRGESRTYYVYDDLGRLRFVLPNLSSTKLNNGDYALDNNTLKAIAYCYQYDDRGNMIYKRLPGCEPQYMVYDQLGQLVLKQDSLQRTVGKWTMCAYDSIGRIVYIAEKALSQNHRELVESYKNRWQVEHYGSNQPNAISNIGYASSFLGNNNLRLLIVYYYDNHDYISKFSSQVREKLNYTPITGYGERYDNATGLLTGTRIYNLSESGFTVTAYFYDSKGRVVQNRSVRSADNYTSTTTTEYHFDGSVAQKLTEQGTENNLVREHYRFTYDHAGRAKNTYYQLNNDEEINLSAFSYDSIGHLAQNLLHNNIDTIRYSYDMRNMLTETNNKHFSERLYYAENLPPHASPCYNGNISAARIAQKDSAFTFAYAYDQQNRLVASNRLLEYASLYSESFTYDDAGNILTLQRFSNNRKIDDLSYDYGNEGHLLLSIADNGQNADQYEVIEYHNVATQTDTTMRYDANGNLVYDADRGISAIHYNLLNLPDTIQFTGGHMILNMYDAMGRKYKSITYTNIASVIPQQYDFEHYSFETDSLYYQITEYTGNIVTYTKVDTTTTILRRIYNAIGYYTDSTYYHYIKDHLGNICAVVNSIADTCIQSTLYYPSGVPMVQSFGRDAQPYLYNGKEFIETHGMNTYDYGFRGYYATIGRFTSFDPLAEQTPWQSPYSYAGNNYTNAIDWMGLSLVNFSTPHCIILGPDMTVLGIYDDGDDWIYIDETGDWKEGDSKDNLKRYLRMTASIEWYIACFTGAGGSSSGLNGTATCQADATYIVTTISVYPQKMSHQVYMESLQKKNDPGRLPSDKERYMQNIPEQNRLLITNPLIDLCAVAIATPYVIEGATWMYVMAGGNPIIQIIMGVAEGLWKGHIKTGQDVPYLYDSLLFQAGSDLGAWLYEYFEDRFE